MNFSALIKQHNTDEWYTPADVVEDIVPILKRKGYKRILCPFDKDISNFPIVLKSHGFEVVNSHIEDGIDFFDLDLNVNQFDAVRCSSMQFDAVRCSC